MLSYSLNVNGRLISLQRPQVMGIVNLTPDSFYSASRQEDEAAIRTRVGQIATEGGDMIDVGAYSSRPGAAEVSEAEEMRRLRFGLRIIKDMQPDAILSVDTFRASVAKMCVEEYGVGIVNDISAGELDAEMFRTVAQLQVPYIIMHMKGTPQTMQNAPAYDDLLQEVYTYFSEKVTQLRDMGVNDIVLDPGFGFAKTLDHNYELMAHMEMLHDFSLPLLVGVSRKSMIYRLLQTTPEEALNGTTALHMVALQKGAHILRVHDVKACAEVVKIFSKLKSAESI
ncbi:MAG: dihydropteroate synthase [Bacteroidaceae bacterium]|nr:dihydropteroate synthase [Bacteroidaceae bacterium]